MVGIGHWQMHHPHRRAARALAGIDHRIVLVGAEEADEILARHDRVRIAGGARGEGGVGGEDRAIGRHHRRFDPRPAERAAQFARDLRGRFGDEILLALRHEAPHQVVLAPTRAQQFDAPAPG